jgi:hypothetical protein
MLSIALVVYIMRPTSMGDAKNGITCSQFLSQLWMIIGYFCPYGPSRTPGAVGELSSLFLPGRSFQRSPERLAFVS